MQGSAAQQPTASGSRPTPVPTPASSIPPHMQAAQAQYRAGTPPSSTPPPSTSTPPNAYTQGYNQSGYSRGQNYGQGSSSGGHGQGAASGSGYNGYGGGYSTYPQQQQQQQQPTPQTQQTPLVSINPAVLAAIPEEQKAMVVHVLSLTQEQINKLAPQDRANIIQLVRPHF